jgi:CubicO group peptidase (beta-lactamase class C family)
VIVSSIDCAAQGDLVQTIGRLAQSKMSSSINSGLVVAIVAASVLAGCSRSSTTRDERDAALAANIEAFATTLAASDEFSGVVLLTRHGQPLVRRGYGLADRKAARPNTPETPFMLSSVSKMFTAVTIAKLVERKQLSFDRTLGSLLPEYPSAEAREQVTVRHLLTMSSGIPDLFRVPEFWAQVATLKSPTDFWKFFAMSPLQFRPGTQWSYSNSNFLLLGAIIERQTGRAFTSVVEAELFRPLGMASIRYEVGGSPQPLHTHSTCRHSCGLCSLVSSLGRAQTGGRLHPLHADGRRLLVCR